MKVEYFGDDLGLGIYIFRDATFIRALQYLRENQFFTSDYFITNIVVKRKYWFFGKQTIKMYCQTEKAIELYGVEIGDPIYKIKIR